VRALEMWWAFPFKGAVLGLPHGSAGVQVVQRDFCINKDGMNFTYYTARGVEGAECVHLVSSEAGQVAEEAKAKCVSAEHVLKAVERLEFTEYLSELRDFVEADREHRDRRRMDKKKRKNNVGGMSEEEAIALQQKLFAEARAQASGKL